MVSDGIANGSFGDFSIALPQFGFSDDLGSFLEQKAFEDLITARTLHFRSLRQRLQQRYKASGYIASSLERTIDDATNDLYDPDLQPLEFDPTQKKKGYHTTHYGLLRKIYKDMWTFQSRVVESCPAPKDPLD